MFLKKEIKQFLGFFVIIVLTLGLSISTQSLLAAWQPPGDDPPLDNVYPPIYNESTSNLFDLIENTLVVGSIGSNFDLIVDRDITAGGIINGNGSGLTDLPWGSLIGVPLGLDDGDDVLTEAQVDAYANNNGYITAVWSGEGTQGGGTTGDQTIQFDCSEVSGTGISCSGEDLYIETGYRGANAICAGTGVYLDGDGNCDSAATIVSTGGAGDITGVYSGTGTQGGAASGNATISFDCSEVDGSGISCSGETLYITTAYRGADVRCSSGYFLNGDGSCDTAANIVSVGGAGDITAVYSGVGTQGGASAGNATIQFDCSEVDGTGLSCSGETLYIDTLYRGADVRCSSGYFLNGDGSCDTAAQIITAGGGGGSTYYAGNYISLSGTTFNVDATNAAFRPVCNWSNGRTVPSAVTCTNGCARTTNAVIMYCYGGRLTQINSAGAVCAECMPPTGGY